MLTSSDDQSSSSLLSSDKKSSNSSSSKVFTAGSFAAQVQSAEEVPAPIPLSLPLVGKNILLAIGLAMGEMLALSIWGGNGCLRGRPRLRTATGEVLFFSAGIYLNFFYFWKILKLKIFFKNFFQLINYLKKDFKNYRFLKIIFLNIFLTHKKF